MCKPLGHFAALAAVVALLAPALGASMAFASTEQPTPPPLAVQDLGDPDPTAPPEINQFAFLVGNHDCVEEVRSPDTGEWFSGEKTWDGRYILGGRAIQDGGESPWRDFRATNIRVYHPDRGMWVVNWFGTPAQSGVWEGGLEGQDLVVRQATPNGTSVLTFHEISDAGFSWRAEFLPSGGQLQPQWRIRCERVGPRG